jgi:hypothetical protein
MRRQAAFSTMGATITDARSTSSLDTSGSRLPLMAMMSFAVSAMASGMNNVTDGVA